MTRFIPKQFAENSTTSVVFGSHQEQGGKVGDGTISSDPATLQGGTAWPLGWSAATDNFFHLPRGEELEGLERVLSAAIIQQFKDGMTFWQPEMPVTQYQTIVQYQTGSDYPKLYVNITGTSTSTPPDSDTTNWFMFFDTAQVYANVALTNSPYTTNRILEIPQDIKLELNNGTLTLKAGSKVYVPNGFEADGTTPKFDIKIIESDLTITFDNTTQKCVVISPSNTMVHGNLADHFISSSTAPSISWGFWYDLTNNQIKWTNDGSTWISGYSLPICIATGTNGSVTSIDQVFNGRGYIGSTVFILPGVKVQAPNGKNEDGTYKSNILTQLSVGLTTFLADVNDALVVRPNSDIPLFAAPWHFDSENGYISTSDNVPTNNGYCILCGYVRTESLKIVDFTFGNVDSVLNSSLSNLSAAGQAKFDAKANISLNNLDAKGNSLVFKPGMMIPWGGTSSNKPDGWLVCDGSAISRTTYSALFAVIGTTYGSGDGSTTFNLPNASNLYLMKTNTTPSVGVKGTGKSLGLRTTSNAYGLCQGGSGGIAYTNAYNVNAGTSVQIVNVIQSSTAIGVSTDSSTSGLNTDTGSMSAITSRLIIKY